MVVAVDTAAATTAVVVESAGKPAKVVIQNYKPKPTKGAVQRPHPLSLKHIRLFSASTKNTGMPRLQDGGQGISISRFQ